ncbi:hypothetical protein Bca52824_004393 [Brassica carinata]|uniref:Uncharacterized protein n=1 Tax=Brassica carinata TaxID=52824 RepID=A0A8X7WLT1_BRACI|nr:hypothetical protein Bca52824_004393 [Brassica carinata]
MTKVVDANVVVDSWKLWKKLSSIASFKRLYLCVPSSKSNGMHLVVRSGGQTWNIVKKMMKGTGVKKMAGESSVEVENRVYRFISGDLSHPHVVKIDELLQEIDLQIESN